MGKISFWGGLTEGVFNDGDLVHKRDRKGVANVADFVNSVGAVRGRSPTREFLRNSYI